MEGIGNESESRRNGKKMKAKEEKLQVKELIDWLESNSDLGQENVVVGGKGKLILSMTRFLIMLEKWKRGSFR